MVYPAGFVTQAQITEAVDKAIQDLGPEVVRVRYSLGPDTHDEPAIHFRVVLAGWAAAKGTIGPVAERIEKAVTDRLRPYENWGMFPYFKFRADYEHTNEKAWI